MTYYSRYWNRKSRTVWHLSPHSLIFTQVSLVFINVHSAHVRRVLRLKAARRDAIDDIFSTDNNYSQLVKVGYFTQPRAWQGSRDHSMSQLVAAMIKIASYDRGLKKTQQQQQRHAHARSTKIADAAATTRFKIRVENRVLLIPLRTCMRPLRVANIVLQHHALIVIDGNFVPVHEKWSNDNSREKYSNYFHFLYLLFFFYRRFVINYKLLVNYLPKVGYSIAVDLFALVLKHEIRRVLKLKIKNRKLFRLFRLLNHAICVKN